MQCEKKYNVRPARKAEGKTNTTVNQPKETVARGYWLLIKQNMSKFVI